MRRRPLAVLALAGALGCGHTKTTDGGTSHPETSPAAGKAAGGSDELPRQPGHPPVVTHAQDLLQPGAEDQIRRKLVARGYLSESGDAPLAEGLRKFQAAQNLPATGVPDHETISRLGLDPAKIFRS